MDYLAPPIFDISNNDMWKFKMCAYFKTLRMYVYFVTTKKSYVGNGKFLEANTQAMDALKHTLSKKNIFL